MKKKNLKKDIQEKMIMDVLNEFDFRKVHDVMSATNWKWSCKNGEFRVPNLYELIKNAEFLLRTILKDYGTGKFTYVCSGGFKASLDEDDYLALEFVVEGTGASEYDYENEEL